MKTKRLSSIQFLALFLLITTLLVLLIIYLPAQTPPKPELPVLVTSCGQSPGPAFLKVIFMRAKLQHEPAAYSISELATAKDLIESKNAGLPVKTLIIVMGASLKGMGAAGISIEDELARTDELIKEARDQGITIIGAHIEGMKRRAQGASVGDNTDEQSIDAVAPNSDILLIHKDGNEDGRFTIISKEKNIPMIEVAKNLDLIQEIKKLFAR